MKGKEVFGVIVGVATILGTVFALIALFKPSGPSSVPPVTAHTTPPIVRPKLIPIDHSWTNASGPQTFSLRSSAAIIEKTRFENYLFVRFVLHNNSRVPVRVWARSESTDSSKPVEAWTIDAGTTLCTAHADKFTVMPIGDSAEDLVRYNDMGRVLDRAPSVASRGDLAFAVRFECEDAVESDAVLFATTRITFAAHNSRVTTYFQTNDLPIYRER